MVAFADLPRRLLGRLRWLAHWRCAEPVLVIESDDWGLKRQPCSSFLQGFGETREWADEELETVEDLECLYETLRPYRDPDGRSACLTANFVVANPDFEAIEASGFQEYHDVPIAGDRPLCDKWVEGIQRRVFFPQYHGRSHLWPQAWLEDLQAGDAAARAMFSRRLYGGPFFLSGRGWSYHSEYQRWSTGEERPPAETLKWLEEGLEFFAAAFGFRPRSSIAPHYVLPPGATRAWRQMGIEYVQGANYHIVRGPDGEQRSISHVLGERSPEGLVYLTRTVKFEPARDHAPWGVEAALGGIHTCFRDGLPAVLDSHRINYTGRFREQGLAALQRLLAAVQPLGPRFLTTVELGEAVAHGGRYRDVWTGEERSLRSLASPWRRWLRGWVEAANRRRAACL